MSQTNINADYGSAGDRAASRAGWSATTLAMLVAGIVILLALAWYALYATGTFGSTTVPSNSTTTQSNQSGSSPSGGTGSTSSSSGSTGSSSSGSSSTSGGTGSTSRGPGY